MLVVDSQQYEVDNVFQLSKNSTSLPLACAPFTSFLYLLNKENRLICDSMLDTINGCDEKR